MKFQNESVSGTVEYKVKNIRHQNRQLNMRVDNKKPRHIYFDDDGNVLNNVDESEEVSSLCYVQFFNFKKSVRIVTITHYYF